MHNNTNESLSGYDAWAAEIAGKQPIVRTRAEMFIHMLTSRVVSHDDLQYIVDCPGELSGTHRMLIAMRLGYVCPQADAHAALDMHQLIDGCRDCLFRRNFLALFGCL